MKGEGTGGSLGLPSLCSLGLGANIYIFFIFYFSLFPRYWDLQIERLADAWMNAAVYNTCISMNTCRVDLYTPLTGQPTCSDFFLTLLYSRVSAGVTPVALNR